MDFYLEMFRIVVITAVLALLLFYRRQLAIARLSGFRSVLAGFSLLIFGAAIDLSDDFPPLNSGHAGEVSAILKVAVGYFGGLALLAIGLGRLLSRLLTPGPSLADELVPICSCCKKVRSEDGEWVEVDLYLHRKMDAAFSHTYCPLCERQNIYGFEDYSI